MKLFLLLQIVLNMSCPNLEITDIIGNYIDNIPCKYESFEIDNLQERSFIIRGENNHLFNKSFVNIVLITDDELFVNKLITDFQGTLDVNFYHFLTQKYGQPDKILKSGKEISRNEETNEGIQSIETKFALVECEFEENPTFLLWDLQDFEMAFTIVNELNKTEVVITKKN